MSDHEDDRDHDAENVDYWVALKDLKGSDFWDVARQYSDRRCKALARRIAELEGKANAEGEQASDKQKKNTNQQQGPISALWARMTSEDGK